MSALTSYCGDLLDKVSPSFQLEPANAFDVFSQPNANQQEPLPSRLQQLFTVIIPNLFKVNNNTTTNIEKLTTSLKHDIKQITDNPATFKGKSLQALPPFNYLLELSKEADQIDLLLPVTNRDRSNHGLNLSVHKAYHLTIPLESNTNPEMEISCRPTVLKQLTEDNVFANFKQVKATNNRIERGLRKHQEWLDHLKNVPGVKLPPLARQVNPRAKETLDSCHVSANENTLIFALEQEWYNGSFADAIENGALPLDKDGSEIKTHKLTLLDLLSILSDMTRTIGLAYQHKLLVHRDLHPSNILVKINANGQAEGILSDFDRATTVRKSNLVGDFAYFDHNCRQGYITPLTDTYALAMNLGWAVIPKFSVILENLSQYLQKKSHQKTKLICMKSYAKKVLKELSIGIENGFFDQVCPQNITEKLKTLVDKHIDLSNDVKQRLEQLPIEVEIVAETLDLVRAAWRGSVESRQMLQKNSEFLETLENGTEDEKRAVVTELESVALSNTHLQQSLDAMQQKLQGIPVDKAPSQAGFCHIL